MTETKIKEVMEILKNKIPEEKYILVKNRLQTANDEVADVLLTQNYHNWVVILLLSIFLGGIGVDRFVIGDIGLGIAKLLINWLTFGLWSLIDIFFCYKKAKEKNFIKICHLI